MWKLLLHLVMEGGKVETCQGFPNSIKEVGGKSPVPVEERRGGWCGMGNFGEGRGFSIGW